MTIVYSLVHQVYLDGVVTVVDSKNCLTQMKGGGDPNASGGLSDWLRQVIIVKKIDTVGLPLRLGVAKNTLILTLVV